MGILDIEFFKKNEDKIVYDQLTGMLSRSIFYEYMKDLVEKEKPFVFFFFDFDDFKSINDVLGHKTGDEALIISSRRITNVIEANGGVVGRYGGDEFFGIIEDMTEYEEVWNIAREINEVIREDNTIKDIEKALPLGRFTITSGISRFPKDGKTIDEIFEVTDKALYRGKQKGKNCFIIYNHELHKNIFKDREARKLDTKNLIDYIFVALTDKDHPLNDNIKHVCSFIANYFDVSIFSKNYNGKFEVIFSNGLIPNAKYVDENKYLDLKSSEIESMIFMYINRLQGVHEGLKKEFEEQKIHASLLIPCATKSKLYGYLRIDSRYERIWAREEKIVFQVLANLYAVILEFTNQEF